MNQKFRYCSDEPEKLAQSGIFPAHLGADSTLSRLLAGQLDLRPFVESFEMVAKPDSLGEPSFEEGISLDSTFLLSGFAQIYGGMRIRVLVLPPAEQTERGHTLVRVNFCDKQEDMVLIAVPGFLIKGILDSIDLCWRSRPAYTLLQVAREGVEHLA